jgi:hypothetical protein
VAVQSDCLHVATSSSARYIPWVRATYELVQGAPRPMKMGSPFPYDAAARHALQLARLRYPTTLHYASRALPSILGGSSACPSKTALSINPGTDVMGTKPEV